jgi:hypothetical protein
MTAMKKHLADLNYPAPRTVSKLADQVRHNLGLGSICRLTVFHLGFLILRNDVKSMIIAEPSYRAYGIGRRGHVNRMHYVIPIANQFVQPIFLYGLDAGILRNDLFVSVVTSLRTSRL